MMRYHWTSFFMYIFTYMVATCFARPATPKKKTSTAVKPWFTLIPCSLTALGPIASEVDSKSIKKTSTAHLVEQSLAALMADGGRPQSVRIGHPKLRTTNDEIVDYFCASFLLCACHFLHVCWHFHGNKSHHHLQLQTNHVWTPSVALVQTALTTCRPGRLRERERKTKKKNRYIDEKKEESKKHPGF